CASFFFFQAEDGIRDFHVTGVQTCALPILSPEQLEYAASDVLYLHQLRDKLIFRLERDGRTKEAEACFRFLPTRAKLDLMGWDRSEERRVGKEGRTRGTWCVTE